MFVAERGAIYDCDLDLQSVKRTAHVAAFDIFEASRCSYSLEYRAATPRVVLKKQLFAGLLFVQSDVVLGTVMLLRSDVWPLCGQVMVAAQVEDA